MFNTQKIIKPFQKLTFALVSFLIISQLFGTVLNFNSAQSKQNNLLSDLKDKVISALHNSLNVNAQTATSSNSVSAPYFEVEPSQQQWYYDAASMQIRNKFDNFCLSTVGTTVASKLTMSYCNSSTKQQWSIEGGNIRNVGINQCISINGIITNSPLESILMGGKVIATQTPKAEYLLGRTTKIGIDCNFSLEFQFKFIPITNSTTSSSVVSSTSSSSQQYYYIIPRNTTNPQLRMTSFDGFGTFNQPVAFVSNVIGAKPTYSSSSISNNSTTSPQTSSVSTTSNNSSIISSISKTISSSIQSSSIVSSSTSSNGGVVIINPSSSSSSILLSSSKSSSISSSSLTLSSQSSSSIFISSSSELPIEPEPEVNLTTDFYFVSEQEIVDDNFPINIPITDNFYQAKATTVGNNFSNEIYNEILGKFKTWESGCDFTLNWSNTWYNWSGCWGDQWVGTTNGARALWNFIWGIIKGELDQFVAIFSVDWTALVTQLKDLFSNIKNYITQIVDLIKNPTILLDLAVAQLDDFNNTEFYQKFYKLGVFISQFTSGVVVFSAAEKSFGIIKNVLTTGKLVEKVGVVGTQSSKINIAERTFANAQKYNKLDNQGRAWIELENGLWTPTKKLSSDKFAIPGADVNWQINNNTQIKLDKITSGVDDGVKKQVINNRKRCIPCLKTSPFPIFSSINLSDFFFGKSIIVSADQDCDLSRGGAFQKAKRDAGITRASKPSKMYREDLLDNGNKIIENGQPVQSRVFEYKKPTGQKVYIQEHSRGHNFGGVGDQKPHFNLRPESPSNPGKANPTGSISGGEDHYYFK
jgi:HNH/Endo VII superfamily nuclease toxins/Ricin-type beta-trefoil lectin domain